MVSFNNRLRQIVILALILLIGILLIKHFYIFLPSILGAVTLYILSRNFYFKMIDKKKWSPGWTAFLYIIFYTVIICLPLYLSYMLVSPKLIKIFNNPVELMVAVKSFSAKIKEATGIEPFSAENVKAATQKISNYVPKLLSSTANIISNLLMMFFVLYHMLINGKKMEAFLNGFIPLKQKNLSLLGSETNMMIKANAIGIPLLAIIQGVVATLGYWIFGVSDFAMWGFLTGIASIIPIVGSGLIWVPLMVYLFAINQTWQGVGLAIYSIIVISNIDYIARITVLKAIGDVHPLITILGVVIGLSMFGFWGLVFGPLLISYFILLVKIYRNEFNAESITPLHTEKKE
jgi:predicted PurR-regulated permease PerM